MSRKSLLPALAACALLAVGAPAASASKAHVANSNTAKAIKFLLKANSNRASEIGALKDSVTGLTEAVKAIHGSLDPIVAAAPTILNALTSINSALTNTTTGLVGLNLARPQFAAFTQTGTFIDGTGKHGSSGPTTDAARGPASLIVAPGPTTADFRGFYVVTFGNDVSSRVFTVDPFPGGPGEQLGAANVPGVPQIVSCASSDSTGNLCFNVEHAASGGPYDATDKDKDVNKVLVQFGNGNNAASPTNGFTITAISG